jgi:hypothetical protein
MDFETVKQLVDGFQPTNPKQPEGKSVNLDVQIEVKNPMHLWETNPDANLFMLKLCSVFTDVVTLKLQALEAQFGVSDSVICKRLPKPIMKEMHQSGKKKYHSAVLVFSLHTWEKFLPMWDVLLPEDVLFLDHPLWPMHELTTAEIVWLDRVRTHKYLVQVVSETNETLTLLEMADILSQEEFNVKSLTHETIDMPNSTILGVNFTAQIETKEFQKTYERQIMYEDKAIKLRLSWKPLSRVSPNSLDAVPSGHPDSH